MDDHIDKLIAACLAVAEGRLSGDQLPAMGADDSATIVDLIHAAMTDGERERAAHAGKIDRAIACARGCDFCCANIIVVYRPEAERVANWLRQPEHRAAREHFTTGYPRWRSDIGQDAARLKQLHERGDIGAAETLYAELQSRHVPCAFVADKLCVIHPVRPNVCRNAHALDSNDRCRPDSVKGPVAVAFPPLDDVVTRAAAIFRVLHRRVHGQEGPSALCDAVAELL